MADKKISQLTAATTPLAGTEVLPIVQSNATVKVATDDLTVKNVRSNATSGILQVVGPAAAATRVMTVPDANFTAARTDAAQSFTGDQTLSTGNLVIGTAGKGIDFSADPHTAGMTSELLSDYEEGTWTPVFSTTSTNFDSITYSTVTSGKYIKIGRTVFIQAALRTEAITVGSAAGNVVVSGLPFAVAAHTAGTANGSAGISCVVVNNFASNPPVGGQVTAGTSYVFLIAALSGTALVPADLRTTATSNSLRFSATYITS